MKTIEESGVMHVALLLIEKHPWNNMVQLKAHLIFEDLFKTEMSNSEKIDFLKASESYFAPVLILEEQSSIFSNGIPRP